MQAPIPSPFDEPARRIEKTKPKGLQAVTLLLCAFNLSAYLFLKEMEPLSVAAALAMVTVLVGVAFVILWFFWLGNNWARILVLLTSLLALANLFLLGDYNVFQQVVLIAEALLGAFLLWWLNTKDVVAYFKQPAST